MEIEQQTTIEEEPREEEQEDTALDFAILLKSARSKISLEDLSVIIRSILDEEELSIFINNLKL